MVNSIKNIPPLYYSGLFILGLWITHCIISLTYGLNMPWGGDEWFTYKDYVLTGTPNNWLVMLLKKKLGPLSTRNFIWYRQVGLFWTSFIYLISYIAFKKNKNSNYSAFLLIFLIYLTLSPFFIFQEQMFRYYGLYLLYSFIINICILKFNDNYKNNRLKLLILLIFSIPVHILLTLQLAIYIAWKEFCQLKAKIKLITGITLTMLGVLVFTFIEEIMKWSTGILSGGKYQVTGSELKGIGLSTFLKPVISIFHYFFGIDILPTENILTIVLFILMLGIVFGSIIIFIIKHPIKKSTDLIFCSIIPFLSIYFILQSITLPGATQMESKHAMFVVFWFIYFIVVVYQKFSKSIYKIIFLGIPISSLSLGLTFSLTSKKENWNNLINVSTVSQQGYYLIDGPASESFWFYGSGKIDTNKIISIWDTTGIKSATLNSNEISLTLIDYKSYQILTKEQMWNTGTGSEMRNAVASFALKTIQKQGFKSVESYSHYPLMTYRFIKTNLIQPIPWFYSYAYADLHLPVAIKKDTVLGWFPYQSGDTIPLTKPFYYMIKSTGAEKITIELIQSDKTSSQLESKTEADKFRSHYCMAITGYDKKVKEWHKRPLLSSSLAYPGSYMPGTGYIYQFNPKPGDKALVVKGKDVKVWVGVEK